MLDWYMELIRRFVGLCRNLRVSLIVGWIHRLAWKLRITALWLPCLPGRVPNQLLHWKQDPFWPFWPLHQVHHKCHNHKPLWTEKTRPDSVNFIPFASSRQADALIVSQVVDKVLDTEVEQFGMHSDPTYFTYSRSFDDMTLL